MIRRLAHVSFVTDDLPRLARFYTEILGLPVKITFRNKEDQIFGYYFDCGDSTFIEVFDRVLKAAHWGGPLEPLQQGNQYNHLSFEVVGMKQIRAQLEAAGVKLSPTYDGSCGSLTTWLADPDGNPVELMEYTANSRQLQRGIHTI